MMTLPVSIVKLLIYEPNLGHKDQWPHIKNIHSANSVPNQDFNRYWENRIIELPKINSF